MTDPIAVHERHRVSWPTLAWVYGRLYRTLAFGFGVGLLRPGSGTWGSVLAFALWWPLSLVFPWEWLGAFILLASIAGIWICHRTVQELGVHDHVGVVWDEIAAVWLVLWVLPEVLWVALLGFVLFRIFDVAKPWPIRSLDAQVGGGFGVMLDDWVAALYAILMALGIFWLSEYFGVSA